MKWFFTITMFFFLLVGMLGCLSSISLLKKKTVDLEERIIVLEQNLELQKEVIAGMNPDSLFNREWLLFKLALIRVESGFNTDAVNKQSNAGGLFQIMPVDRNGFLREANRLIGYVEFTDSCRFDPERSNDMFEIVNRRYNPEKSIDKAITLHNPRAGIWYRDRVLREYEFLKSISNQLNK